MLGVYLQLSVSPSCLAGAVGCAPSCVVRVRDSVGDVSCISRAKRLPMRRAIVCIIEMQKHFLDMVRVPEQHVFFCCC